MVRFRALSITNNSFPIAVCYFHMCNMSSVLQIVTSVATAYPIRMGISTRIFYLICQKLTVLKNSNVVCKNLNFWDLISLPIYYFCTSKLDNQQHIIKTIPINHEIRQNNDADCKYDQKSSSIATKTTPLGLNVIRCTCHSKSECRRLAIVRLTNK